MSSFLLIGGRQPELSAAEVAARLPDAVLHAVGDVAVRVDDDRIVGLFPVLGGAVKLGKVALELASVDELRGDRFFQNIHPWVAGEGKAVFGVSVYGDARLQRAGAQLGKAFKTFLAENGRPARFLVGERGILSSVVVAKERVIERGAELLLVQQGSAVIVAVTCAVQAFEDFSRHDYGRPQRDSRSGMLPPKLARMMVNMSGVDQSAKLLDPFCGSGTVLQEALLLGFSSLVGTDVAQRAITQTAENIAWLEKHETLAKHRVVVKQCDVQELGKILLPASVDAIVTEPFLGPSRRTEEDEQMIRQELEALYLRAFRMFVQLLRPAGRLVFAAPVFFVNGKPHGITNLDALLATGFRSLPPLPSPLLATWQSRLSFRGTLLYHREGQRVA